MKDITPENWPYLAPENTVLYAIGDLHGHLDAHKMLYALIELEAGNAPEKQHVVVYLGDYIDRGPASSQIIERLRTREDNHITHEYLMGNHEYGFLGFLDDPHSHTRWLDYGGIETAQSYGVLIKDKPSLPSEIEALQQKLLQKVPASHLDFLKNLDYITIHGGYAFVHAGIKPGIPLMQQKAEDLRFIREPFLSWEEPHEKCIVHGHTITKQPEVKSNRVNLDTGLFKHGILSCGVFEENTVKLLQINKNDE